MSAHHDKRPVSVGDDLALLDRSSVEVDNPEDGAEYRFGADLTA